LVALAILGLQLLDLCASPDLGSEPSLVLISINVVDRVAKLPGLLLIGCDGAGGGVAKVKGGGDRDWGGISLAWVLLNVKVRPLVVACALPVLLGGYGPIVFELHTLTPHCQRPPGGDRGFNILIGSGDGSVAVVQARSSIASHSVGNT